MKRLLLLFTVVLLSTGLVWSQDYQISDKDPNPVNVNFTGGTDAVEDLLFFLDVESIVADNQCLGIEFDGTFLWVTGGGNATNPNYLYQIDPLTQTLVNAYDQTTVSSWGMRDLAFDGTFLYAGDENGFYRIDPGTGNVTLLFDNTAPVFTAGISAIRALAWDGVNFWSKNFGGDLYVFDPLGNVVAQYPITNSTYGAAYDPTVPCIWLFSTGGATGNEFVQVDMAGNLTGITHALKDHDCPTGGIIGGAFFYQAWAGGRTILGALTQGTPDAFYAMELYDTGYPGAPTNPNPTCGGGGLTSGNLTWDFGINTLTYDVYLGPAGSMVPVATGLTVGGPTGSYAYTGLTAGTNYEWMIIGYNATGPTSSLTWNFTPVAPVAAPLFEDFETFTPGTNATGYANGWSTFPENTTGSYRWNVDAGGTTSSGTGPTVDHTTGTATGIYLFTEASSGSTADEAYVYSPFIDLSPLTVPMVEFWYHMYGAAMGELHLDIMAVGGGGWVLDIVPPLIGQQTAAQGDPYQLSQANLGAYAGQTVQFRFRGIRGTSYTGDMAIDDFRVFEMPSCPAPQNQTVAGITGTSADLGWTEMGSATMWDIEMVPAGTPPTGTPTAAGVTSNPYTYGGLNPITSYDWYVRADCGGSQSTWTGPNTFTTACATVSTFPWCEDFENGGSIPACWYEDPGFTAGWLFRTSMTYGPTGDHTTGSGYFATIDDSSPYTSTPSVLVSPVFDVTGLTTPIVRFWYWIGDFNAGPSYIEVEAWDGSAWQNTGVTLTENNQWQEVVIVLTPWSNANLSVRFLGYENTAGFNCDLAIDDVCIQEQPIEPIDWCNLQWPPNGSINIGDPFTAYAQVYEAGVTDSPGPGPGINAYIGFSSTDTDPATWTDWVPATYNLDFNNNDEWMADIGAAIPGPGTWYYASRFNLNGGPDAYGGYNAGGGGFWDGVNNVSGVLTVSVPTFTWTGLIDSNWDDPGNWNPSGVPSELTAAIIPGGAPNYPVLTGNLQINNTGGAYRCLSLWIQNGGQLEMFEGADLDSYGELTIDAGGTLYCGDDFDMNAGAVLNMNGGMVVNNYDFGAFGDFYFKGGATINLNGGSFEVYDWIDVYAGSIWNGSDVDIIVGGPNDLVDFYNDEPTFVFNNFLIRNSCSVQFEGFSAATFNLTGDFTVEPLAWVDINQVTNVGGNAYILSDASGSGSLIDAAAFTVTGTSNVDRYYTNFNAWSLISSPIADGQAGIYLNMYLQLYDEPGSFWFDIIPPTDPLIPAMGYALWVPYPMTSTYTGALNTGAISIPVTNTGTAFGWNLLGNPYPSGLNWDDVALANPDINGAVYYLDASTNNFVSYNGGMGGGLADVPPGQGFFVSANTVGTFNVDNTMRTHAGQGYFYKEGLSNMLALEVEGNGYTDAVYMRFDETATEGFDGEYDAYKLISWFNDEIPQVYMPSEGVDLSINVLPATETVPVGFTAGVSDTYTFSLAEVHDFDYVILEDLLTGDEVNLVEGSYTFTYSVNDDPNRFLLHFAPLSVPELSGDVTSIYSYGNDVYVYVPEDMDGSIMVYDMLGHLVTSRAINTQLSKITLDQSAYYIVKVLGDTETVTRKVFID